MSFWKNWFLYIFFGLALLFAALPFLLHYGLLDVFWYDAKHGEWSFFLPFWLSIFVLDFMFGNTELVKPSKDNLLFIILGLLTVISFIGSVIMMTLFFVDIVFPAPGFWLFLLSLLLSIAIVAASHFYPVFSLFNPMKMTLQELRGIGNSSAWPAGAGDYDSDGFSDDNYDMTRDYYGKHGEFDKNDDAWGTSEYIRQFHNNDPDVDLSDHFDWQERLDAETDGFLDDVE